MAEGVDFSGDRPSGICLYSSGKRFAARYFGPGGSWKHATRTEVKGLIAGGLQVVALAEGAVMDPMKGYSMGRSHAVSANVDAITSGMPASRPIYFAIDWDIQPADLYVAGQYLDGCASVMGRSRVGVYGGYRAIEFLVGNGYAKWGFQTYAWSGGKWSKRAHFQQYRNGVKVCGATVDLCRSVVADFGQWPIATSAPGQPPIPPSDSTAATPWEFTDLLTNLADQVGSVGVTLDETARIIEGLR